MTFQTTLYIYSTYKMNVYNNYAHNNSLLSLIKIHTGKQQQRPPFNPGETHAVMYPRVKTQIRILLQYVWYTIRMCNRI